jgi:predicted nuclease with TOPRIM domain
LILRLIKEFDVIQSDFNCIKDKGRIQSELLRLNNDIEKLRKEGLASEYDPNRHDDDLEKLKRNYDNYASNL